MGIHACSERLTLPGKPRIVRRMNRVILAYSQLQGALPAAQRERLRAQWPYSRRLRMSVDAHRQSQTHLGLALACRLLGAVSGGRIEPSALRFARTGKPYVPGCPDFSIAHAGDWVLCALAADGAVGIDVEERAAAPAEAAALGIWVAKEATLKAAGATLSELAGVRLHGRRIGFRGRHWYLRSPRLAAGLLVRVVTARPVTQLELRAVPLAAALAA
jgi:4'-phosphopantetheinyl transferase